METQPVPGTKNCLVEWISNNKLLSLIILIIIILIIWWIVKKRRQGAAGTSQGSYNLNITRGR
jgi:flagellar biogenesis protein FliO